jgi:hypothetical protein
MTGQPITNPMDATGCQIVRLGKAVEKDVFEQAIAANICVASGVKVWVEDVKLAFELDGVLLDKDTQQGLIAEIKSFDGYFASKRIVKEGKPKLEHMLQLVVYLNELRTGARMKDAIEICAKEARDNPEAAARHRNRIQVYQPQLDLMGNGELGGKLLYVDRTGRNRREFDIGIYMDTDGLHYPSVDGIPWKVFTIENIYQRYKTLQDAWQRAIDEAERRLMLRGVQPPLLVADNEGNLDEASKKAGADFWEAVRLEIAELPAGYMPPAEYQYKYTAEKVEDLKGKGLITDKKYKEWEAKHKIIGAWQCRYCRYKAPCVAMEYPELRYLMLNTIPEEDE